MWGQPAQPAPPAVWHGTRTIVDTSDPPATTYLQVRRGGGGDMAARKLGFIPRHSTTWHTRGGEGRGGEALNIFLLLAAVVCLAAECQCEWVLQPSARLWAADIVRLHRLVRPGLSISCGASLPEPEPGNHSGDLGQFSVFTHQLS